MSNQFDHLSPAASEALKLTLEERIDYVRQDRWIGYPRAVEIIDELEDLLTHPKIHRMPNRLLVSDTNNGKTMIANRVLGKHPIDDNPDGDSIIAPVLMVQAPSEPDEGRLYDGILKKIGAPFRENDRVSKKQFQVFELFKRIGVLMLIIDEIHDLLAGGTVHQKRICNAIKHLGNELRIPIVAIGIPEAFHVFQSDPQLANRFKPLPLPKWSVSIGVKPQEDPYLKLLSSFERMLPLNKPSNLPKNEIALELLIMSEGLIGELSEVLKLAAIKAIRTKKEQIDLELLSKIKWLPPSKRKWALSK